MCRVRKEYHVQEYQKLKKEKPKLQGIEKKAAKQATIDMEHDNWAQLPGVLQQFDPQREGENYPHTGLSWHGVNLEAYQKRPMCAAAYVFIEAKSDWPPRKSLGFGEQNRMHKHAKGCCSEPLVFVLSTQAARLFNHVSLPYCVLYKHKMTSELTSLAVELGKTESS